MVGEACVRARMCETCICGRVHCGMMRNVYGGKMMSVCTFVHASCYHFERQAMIYHSIDVYVHK